MVLVRELGLEPCITAVLSTFSPIIALSFGLIGAKNPSQLWSLLLPCSED